MFPGIHDGSLVGYAVDATRRQLSLSVVPEAEDADPFQVVFSGYVAHFFPAPHLPATLDSIYPVDAGELLTNEWRQIQAGYTSCGFPGAWGRTLPDALSFLRANHIAAYQIVSSYGLSGWVLATSAATLSHAA